MDSLFSKPLDSGSAYRLSLPPMKIPDEVRAYGRFIGAQGGKARAAKLTPERRSDIARKAARARWDRPRPAPKTKQEKPS